MKKQYHILKESYKEDSTPAEEKNLNLFENIFSNKNVDLYKRLMSSIISNKDIDKLIAEVERREKSRDDEKFYRYEIFADGIYLNVFDDNGSQTLTHLEELPVSTTLLELMGESYSGENIQLSCFIVPNFYDPDLSDYEMEHSIRHKNIEITAEFFFGENECLKVRLAITKLSPCLRMVIDDFEVCDSKAEFGVFITSQAMDTPAALLIDPYVHLPKNKFFAFNEPPVSRAKIIVIGIGGGNAINRMIDAGVSGVDFVAVNTDVQALDYSKALVKIQIGGNLTRGRGTGANPMIGRKAALEDSGKLLDVLTGADMVFVAAGLGGGMGTGAAPVIAALARSLEILTVGVVTKPFTVEGKMRMAQAEQGLAELRNCVDTVITIPNSKLKREKEKITITNAFRRADDMLLRAVQGISSLVTTPGVINLDFADIRALIKDRGDALLGVGEAKGERAAINAMKAAIDSKFFEGHSIKGATGILTNFCCPQSTPLSDIEEAVSMMAKNANENAEIFLGTTFNSYEDYVQLTFIAAGDSNFSAGCLSQPTKRRTVRRKGNTAYSVYKGESNKTRLNLLS